MEGTYRLKRLNRLQPQVSADLERMLGLLNRAEGADFDYLARQAAKYLRPIEDPDARNDLERCLRSLRNGFGNLQVLYYDTELVYQHKRSLKLAAAFMHAPLGGGAGPIRINGKAVILSDLVFAGTLVHEATHILLNTVDLRYDVGVGSLKALSEDDRFRNADNWRLFYQKMRKRFRNEPMEVGEDDED